MSSQIKEKIFCTEEAIWEIKEHANYANCSSFIDTEKV
jgi:hypothetical protein